MGTPASPIVQTADLGAAYQAVYDALGKAYWEASDLNSKDLVYGAQQALGEIISALDEQELETSTALFLQLTPQIKAVNTALTQIQNQINTITKNISTAGTVISVINKALSLFPVA